MLPSNILGNRIESIRKSRGLTQQAVADCIEVKRETVNQWESGTRQVKADAIVKLAKLFEVSSDYLLGLSDIESSDTDLRSVCEYTGLSEDAIDWLNIAAVSDTWLLSAVDKLISDYNDNYKDMAISLKCAGACARISKQKAVEDFNSEVFTLIQDIKLQLGEDFIKGPHTDIPDGYILLGASDASEFYIEKAINAFRSFANDYVSRLSTAHIESL